MIIAKQNLMTKLKSISLLFYFIVLVIHNLYNNIIVEYFWYIVLIICFLLGVVKSKIKLNRQVLVFLGVFFLSAVLFDFCVL